MDLYCQKCGEPWDSYAAHKRTKREVCEAEAKIDGRWYTCEDGVFNLDSPMLADAAPEDASIECAGNIEGPTEDCEECDGSGRVVVGEGEDADEETCEVCSGDGWRSLPEVCDTCGQEIEEIGDHHEVVVVAECALHHEDCAREKGWVTHEVTCEACKGTGEIEVIAETDLGSAADIDAFNRGEGCPCCDWGRKVRQWECECNGWALYTAELACRKCGQETRVSARAEAARELYALDPDPDSRAADGDLLN